MPICDNKPELMTLIFSRILPEILPELFPESKTFEWINSATYLPEEYIIFLREKKLQQEYETRLSEMSTVGDEIMKKYIFLNNLLTETGDKLVKAVCEYMKWLVFENITEMDGKENVFREDIQKVEGKKLYIIEVKGIGGTSSDAECAQVAKYRRKREKKIEIKRFYRYTVLTIRDILIHYKDIILLSVKSR